MLFCFPGSCSSQAVSQEYALAVAVDAAGSAGPTPVSVGIELTAEKLTPTTYDAIVFTDIEEIAASARFTSEIKLIGIKYLEKRLGVSTKFSFDNRGCNLPVGVCDAEHRR